MNAVIDCFQIKDDMEDVQSGSDDRCLPIQQVGIKDFAHPIVLRDLDGSQNTIANCSFYVSLPAQQRGTHMSRFINIMQGHSHDICVAEFHRIPSHVIDALNAESSRVEMEFKMFRHKTAPISGQVSLMDYKVSLCGEYSEGRNQIWVSVAVPVTSLCPCSKKISKHGAHNQRSLVTLTVQTSSPLWIAELIDVAESNASAEVFSLVKRDDEKYLTEHAYENPKFVEDMVRDLALTLRDDPRISGYRVETENFESIHNHSAYAMIDQLNKHNNA